MCKHSLLSPVDTEKIKIFICKINVGPLDILLLLIFHIK